MTASLWLIPALPLLGAVINGLLSVATGTGKLGPNRGFAALIAVLMPALSFALTIAAAFALERQGTPLTQVLWTWFQVGGTSVDVSLLFDRLSSMMLLFVTGIGTLIHLYSVGYMWEDRGFARFLCYLNLFMFSMIMLVLGGSLPVTFLGWEGVGLCSYLLVGFWYHNDDYNDAAKKAFVVNRIGDLGFILGAFALVAVCGSLDYVAIATWFAKHPLGAGGGLATAAALLIFFGCTGKSAQIPLLTWLPDAMAGPTPVSALIHAATMVTSGVYLVARLGELFVSSGTVPFLGLAPLDWIMVLGGATAVFGAIAGLFQHDIKKALAYSTVSQLGFMFLAAGAGRFDIALFHVFTHAFFKALLFLGSGAVIHGLGHEQDLRRMGGLAKLMPFTCVMMSIGWLAIIGVPPFAGFWSKDLILESLWLRGGLGSALCVVAVLTALVTAVYMTRMMVLAFWSPSRVDAETKAHLHPVPFTMALPLIILAIGSLGAGLLWMGVFHIETFSHYLAPVLGHAQDTLAAKLHGSAAPHDHSALAWAVAGIGSLAAVIGALAAWRVWGKGPAGAIPPAHSDTAPTGFGGAWTYGFDRVYDWCVVWPVRALAFLTYYIVELLIVGGLTKLVATLADLTGDGLVQMQRSRLRSQLAMSMLGAVLILAVLLWSLMKAG